MSGMTGVAKLRLGLKSTQLILSCVCIGLLQYTHAYKRDLFSITFGGYIIICSGLLLGFITQQYVCNKVDLLYTLVGMCLNVVSGSLLIHEKAHDTGIACGSLAIISAAIFLFDAICMYRSTDEYTPHN